MTRIAIQVTVDPGSYLVQQSSETVSLQVPIL